MKNLFFIGIILALTGLFVRDNVKAQTPTDKVYDFLALPNSVVNQVTHYNRKKDASGNYLNTWDITTSSQKYDYSFDRPNNRWVFRRQQISDLPEPASKYIETFYFDNSTSPRDSQWIYGDYFSSTGDIFPSKSNAATCVNAETNLDGCDYARTKYQEWLKNISATISQNDSQSLTVWDASTLPPDPGSEYYQGGLLRTIHGYRYYGQLWRRDFWDQNIFLNYASTVNTAESLGWQDPPIDLSVSFNPKSVFILRQYSVCDTTPSDSPWHSCEIFEDHVYGIDANGKQLGEILLLVGFTPKHNNWYQTAGDKYAVFHIMIAHSSTTEPSLNGDLNADGKVNLFDYNLLVTDFGKTGNPGFSKADLDSNGKVDIFDYNLLVTNFGKTQ